MLLSGGGGALEKKGGHFKHVNALALSLAVMTLGMHAYKSKEKGTYKQGIHADKSKDNHSWPFAPLEINFLYIQQLLIPCDKRRCKEDTKKTYKEDIKTRDTNKR